MTVKIKLRIQEYPKIFNTIGTGNRSKIQFLPKGDAVSFKSEGNKCGFAYTENHATMQVPIMDVSVKLQEVAVLSISNATEDLKLLANKRQLELQEYGKYH